MALTAPLNVHWELTNVCNLNCVHCYQQDDATRSRIPSAETLMKIARKIVDAQVFEVTLTGGEVLLVRPLPRVVEFLNTNGLRPHITSNGMLVDDRMADWLASVDVTFQVSLDGAEPSQHNAIRRSPRAFEGAMAGVERLVARGVEVSLAYTAAAENLAELPAVVALAAQHGVGRVCVGEVLPEFGTATDRRRLRVDPSAFASFVAGLPALREQYQGTVEVAVALLSGHLYDSRLKASPCTALERDLAILYDGWAYPCPFVRGPEYRLGHVLQHSIKELWSGPAAQRFRDEKQTKTTKHCISGDGDSRPVLVPLRTRASRGSD